MNQPHLTRFFLRAPMMALVVVMVVSATSAQEDDAQTFTDAAGLCTVPVPTNWTVEETADYVVLQSP